MKKLYTLVPALLLLLAQSVAVCQTPAPSPQKQGTQQKEDVVRVTTNLVQVDVVVTDADGKQVTDLRPEEFEVQEDGKKQQITNFSFISTGHAPPPVAAAAETAAPAAAKNAPKVAPALLRPEQVRRTIALVVDDLGLSFESVGYVRQALKKFVDEQMQSDDLVAIMRTSAGSGASQQFTSDKRRLYAAIDRVQWYPMGRGGESPFPVNNSTEVAGDFKATTQVINEFEEEREAAYSVGTFGTLGSVIKGMSALPGRKAVVFVSEAFRLFTTQGRNERLLASLRRITEQANLASTVIYTLDASGLQTLTLTASDKVAGPSYTFDPRILGGGVAASTPPRVTNRVDQSLAQQAERDSQDAFRKLNSLADQRRNENIESQTVLSYLAQQTGGLFINNRNDISGGLQKVADDQKGYYLIGYRPDESTVDAKTGRRRFHQLAVKVKRSGLRLRSRNGYFGLTDEERRANPQTRDEQLTAALTSPFASDGVRLRLTPLFGDAPDEGSFIRALLQIDAHDLSFTDEADGSHKVALDIVAVSFGTDGRVLDQFAQTRALQISPEAYQQILQEGLIYSLNVPAKQAGALQLRVAVRDSTRGSVGAASQFIEIPDLKKSRLTLSGIILNGTIANSSGSAPSTVPSTSQEAGPAVRRLRPGMILNYGYTIFNAQLDTSTNRPQVQTQMRLYRDGKEVFTGRVLPFDASQQEDLKRLSAGGRIRIGPDLLPGQYILQVAVTDALAKDKNRTATQWIDFEIVN